MSRDVAASVRQKILNQSRSRGEDFQLLLTRYALERFLYRLSRSVHRDRFVLKGAMLFTLWEGDLHRITRDVDLLGFGSPATDSLVTAIQEVCAVDVEDDGLTFLADQVSGAAIREGQAYDGVRVIVPGHLGSARIRLQVDVGFGDAITPRPEEAMLPAILDYPAPVLRTYPKETVVAEKLQAMVVLGIANSRMKDFYDIAYLARHFAFEGSLVAAAIRATFERRRTDLPTELPIALTDEFASDHTKQTQWRAFLLKAGLASEQDLGNIIAILRAFLWPPLTAAAAGATFNKTWTPPGPWK